MLAATSKIFRPLQRAAGRVTPLRTQPCTRRRFSDHAFDVEQSKVLPEFYIVDSTLREGEQFATCDFTSHDRLYIAKLLDSMGVNYIELVNPLASEQARRDCEAIADLGTKAKIVTHTRCHMSDVKAAVGTGIDGVNMYMATSAILSKHSHGKGINEVIQIAQEVLSYVKDHGMEVRFSCEDAFRSNLDDILRIYEAVDKLGVHRVGVADTVGVATPSQVAQVIKAVRGVIKPSTGIEFHTHNDTGCCIANALIAMENGATHIDTSVLGLGERNGITSLGGLLARLYTMDKEYIKKRFRLDLINHLDRYVAQKANITIPFNNYITGAAAFTHKAGVHSKAVMQNPDAYEVLNPDDFHVKRRIQFAHRLTGWNAVKQRAVDIGLENLTDDMLKKATNLVKNLSEVRSVGLEELDRVLHSMNPNAGVQQTEFIEWSGDVEKDIETANRMLPKSKEDNRPTRKYRVRGHLFDKAVINRLMDVCVDSSCEFKVLDLKVPPVDRRTSTAIIQIWGTTDSELDGLQKAMEEVISGLRVVAACDMTVLK